MTALHTFLDELAPRHIASQRTVSAYRVAVKALQRTLDDGQAEDLRALDIDTALGQFRATSAGTYTDHTLNTYANNAAHAVRMFLAWVNNGRDWTGLASDGQSDLSDRWETYRLALQADRIISIRLPLDLTPPEAARVAAFVAALAIEPACNAS